MLRVLMLLALISFSVLAEDHALVRMNDTWRFQNVTGAETDPQPGWNQVDYDDSAWLSGFGSFGTARSGYGNWPDTTRLDTNAIAYAFRKKFTLSNPDSIHTLHLRIDYQHGFIAYLNGLKIAQRSMVSSNLTTPSFSVPANPHTRGPAESIDLGNFIPFLQIGPNVLAIQLHNTEGNLEMALAAELTANFSRGPFVQNDTHTSIQVIWRTPEPTTGFVLYGQSENNLHTVLSSIASTNHAVTLTNLQPGQTYIYRVFADYNGSIAAADWSSFRTLKAPGSPIRFQVLGDTGQLTPGQFNIANRMAATPTDLVLHTGDIQYPWYIASQADLRVFNVYREQMRTTPFFFSMGNHDGYYNLTDYQNDFYLPTNSATGTEIFYSFDHGDAHFVAVAADTQSGQRYDVGSVQYQWLENDLASSTQRWKFLYFHHVIRSSSLHSWDDYLFDRVPDKYALQAHIGGLAEKYGAQIIFNGHDHNYERFAAYGGVNSFVTGGGGASLYPQQFREFGSAQYFMRHHFLDVTVDGPSLIIEAKDENGIVLDRFHRSQISSTNYNSLPGAPTIESTAGNDGGGNISGQTFDFSGPYIATRAGLSGNLGRIYIRNDLENIYIGFEQAVVHDNQVIALFLENPSAPGVIDIAPLGDNQPGGDVDGLDLLAGLGLKNFRPSIACLLGDEQADSTHRNFHRPVMRWPAGQGVFKLDQNFSNVEGARVQQFNRNPQVAPQFPESNADFIEVAIPLAAFGPATTQLRLGAIIFGDPASGPLAPEIDTAFAGRSLELGDNRVFLEPLTVHLAFDPKFSVFRSAQHQLRFSWHSIPGAKYWIQRTTDLSEPFTDITNGHFPRTALFGEMDYDMDTLGLLAPQFFRLRWE